MPHDMEYMKGCHHHQQVVLAAQSMIERYRDRAAKESGIRAAELDAMGDAPNAAMWRDITKK